MKRHLLPVLMLMLPVLASADQTGSCGDNATYTYEEATQTLTISGAGEMSSSPWRNTYIRQYIKTVVICNGITSVADNAFSQCSAMTTVTLPTSLTTIGSQAFLDCKSLASIVIPEKVTSVGSSAFSGCSSLTSVTINCAEVGNWFEATYYSPNTSIKEVYLGEGVTTIGESAFSNLDGMTFINLPNNLITIGKSAFYSCDGLTSIDLPENLTTIGTSAFQSCSGLTSLTIPNSVTTIGENAFESCSGLTSLTLSNSLSTISKSAFQSCSALTSVVIPNSVTTIGECAFQNCNSLASITIGAGVAEIGSYAFDYNNNGDGSVKRKVIWLTNTPPSGYVSGSAVNYVANERFSLNNMKIYPFLSSLFEVDGIKYVPVIPSERTCDAIDCVYDESAAATKIGTTATYQGITMTVKNVMPYLCFNNQYVRSVELDYDGIIPDYAFRGCVNLERAQICDKINYIGNYAFAVCPSLETLGTKAFVENCSAPSIEISEAISQIGNYAFDGCSKIKDVIMDNKDNIDGIPVRRHFDDIINKESNKTTTIDFIAYAGDTLSFDWSWHRPSGYGGGEFEVSLNDEKIVTTTDFNGSFEKIFTEAGFMTLTIDVSWNTSSITYSVTNMVHKTHLGGLALGSNGSKPLFASCPLDSIYIGCDIVYHTESKYGYSPFCNNMTLRSVAITDKETEISENEFSGCSGMKLLQFGSGIESIGKEAFSDCSGVTTIISSAVVPPVCYDQALDDINKWVCKVLVPKGSLADYQQAGQWKEFFFIEEFTPGEVEPVELEKCATPTIAYVKGQLQFGCATDNARIVSHVRVADAQTSDGLIDLTQTYVITAYALAPGYNRSDLATATIKWRNGSPVMEGFANVTLEEGEMSCDVNQDGKVDVADIATILSDMASRTRERMEIEE